MFETFLSFNANMPVTPKNINTIIIVNTLPVISDNKMDITAAIIAMMIDTNSRKSMISYFFKITKTNLLRVHQD